MRRLAITVAVLAGAALLAAGSAIRIPAGEVGISGPRWLRPGWHLHVPFTRVPRIAAEGTLETSPVMVRTPQGASHQLAVTLRYRLGPAPGADLATALGGQDLAASAAAILSGSMLPAIASNATRAAIDSGDRPGSSPGGTADENGADASPNVPPSAATPARAAAASSASGLRRSGTGVDPVGAALAARLRQSGIEVVSLEWRRMDAGSAAAPVPSDARHRVLVIGLDAADWEIIDPLVRAGRLPHIADLVRNGARAPLRSYDPMISPLIWTTMVTGVAPSEHGIADFLVTDERTG